MSCDLDLWPLGAHIGIPLICANFVFVSLFSSYAPARGRRTNGRARRVMRPIGRPRNKLVDTGAEYTE